MAKRKLSARQNVRDVKKEVSGFAISRGLPLFNRPYSKESRKLGGDGPKLRSKVAAEIRKRRKTERKWGKKTGNVIRGTMALNKRHRIVGISHGNKGFVDTKRLPNKKRKRFMD